jgi:RNA polymerase sigma-70 factor, ECF subfamily
MTLTAFRVDWPAAENRPGGQGVRRSGRERGHHLRSGVLTLPRAFAPSARSSDEGWCEERIAALVESLRLGDDAAFDELYRLTRDEVARTLVNLLGRRGDLEDLIQDTYLRLLKSVKGFRGEAKFKTFLYRVCANVAFMHLRWWRRRPEDPVAEVPERVCPGRDPEAEAQRSQAQRLVQQALSKLTAKKRVVFVYHELCGLGPDEISEIVGSSYNTVRSRLHHARLEFTAELQRLLDGAEPRASATVGSAAPQNDAESGKGGRLAFP